MSPRDPLPSECNDLPVPELPVDGRAWAYFLDIDGTLLELAETPEAVTVPAGLVPQLERLRDLAGGALALVSGRPLRDIDRLFAPARFPAAGVHGAELRLTDGTLRRIAFDPRTLDPARDAFGAFAAANPEIRVEDKVFGVTLHFRRRPDLAAEAHRLGTVLSARLGPAFHLLEGKMVVEVRASAASKGSAVDAFLQDPPFAGRVPVYVGDDLTDEDAFRAVNALGGISVVVGTPEATRAATRLPDVAAVRRWLAAAAENLERGA